MREIALYDAKNGLSALVQEVEETGEEIIITRHGKPAARLAPVTRSLSVEERLEAWSKLRDLRARIAANHPDAAPIDWESLKREMHNEDTDWLP